MRRGSCEVRRVAILVQARSGYFRQRGACVVSAGEQGSTQRPRANVMALGRSLIRRQLSIYNWILPSICALKRNEAPITALCVYRIKNVPNVLKMIQQLPGGAEVRLHALGEVSSDLVQWTVSSGPGPRMVLLNALFEVRPVISGSWLVIFDDDASFLMPGKTKFFDWAVSAELDIAQPSIHVGQPASHGSRRTQPPSTVRQVGFVEVGPVVAFSPGAVRGIDIFPANSEMGWGADVRWALEAARIGVRMGIVDATPIFHRGAIGVAYDITREERLLTQTLLEHGVSWRQMMSSHIATWRPCQRHPPWLKGDDSAR